MTRKSQASLVEQLIKKLAGLPWWLLLILALASYFGLRMFVDQPSVQEPPLPGQVGGLMRSSLAHTAAKVGQYVVPLILLAAAALSVLRQRRNNRLLELAKSRQSASAISGMHWRDFELLIAEGFRQRGFTVNDKGGQGPDGGVDLALKKDGERFLVQCKHWRASKVGVAIVRELYGVMSAEAAAGGFVVTSGTFTEEAKSFAEGRNIELIDGLGIAKWLIPIQQQTANATHSFSQPVLSKAEQTCPRCGAEMRVRTAKNGPSPGQKFLGCSKYPACKGTRSL